MVLKDRVALVPGSTGGGMGRSSALTLARNGARIVLNHGTHRHNQQARLEAQAIKEAVENLGRQALLVEVDTSQGVTDAVLFLCTEKARFATGAHLNFAIQ